MAKKKEKEAKKRTAKRGKKASRKKEIAISFFQKLPPKIGSFLFRSHTELRSGSGLC